MNAVVPTPASSITSGSEGVPCVLGLVRDDWDAAERWLDVLAARRPPVSPHTVANYRREIQRIRWYCNLVGSDGPSRWSIPDVTRYLAFLRERSGDHVCGRRTARAGDPDWTPFRTRLGASALANAQKVLHALLKFWFEAGYRRANPMASIGSGGGVGRDAPRRHAVPPDLIEEVLESMEQAARASVEKRLMFLRDRFILRLLQFTGLRASEVVLANMGTWSFTRIRSPGARIGPCSSDMEKAEDRAGGLAVERDGRPACLPLCIQLSARARLRRPDGTYSFDAHADCGRKGPEDFDSCRTPQSASVARDSAPSNPLGHTYQRISGLCITASRRGSRSRGRTARTSINALA